MWVLSYDPATGTNILNNKIVEMGIENIRALKALALEPKPSKVYIIPKKSKKRLEREKYGHPVAVNAIDEFFKACRKQMTGTCQCGCGNPSQKSSDQYYRHSVAHIFPKAIFESIKTHPLNWVERAFWGGCHGTMDNAGVQKWPGMADWDDIAAKVSVLYPLLTPQEKAHKFTVQLISFIKNS